MLPSKTELEAGQRVRILTAPKGGVGIVIRYVPVQNKLGDWHKQVELEVTSDEYNPRTKQLYRDDGPRLYKKSELAL